LRARQGLDAEGSDGTGAVVWTRGGITALGARAHARDGQKRGEAKVHGGLLRALSQSGEGAADASAASGTGARGGKQRGRAGAVGGQKALKAKQRGRVARAVQAAGPARPFRCAIAEWGRVLRRMPAGCAKTEQGNGAADLGKKGEQPPDKRARDGRDRRGVACGAGASARADRATRVLSGQQARVRWWLGLRGRAGPRRGVTGQW
jgi:hypothetical protein